MARKIQRLARVSGCLEFVATRVFSEAEPEQLRSFPESIMIASQWDDMLRLAASFKFGHVTASLLVGKLSASSRQNALAGAH